MEKNKLFEDGLKALEAYILDQEKKLNEIKLARDTLAASQLEPLVIDQEKQPKKKWQLLSPSEEQKITLAKFGIIPSLDLTREKAACLIDTLIKNPPANKRIIEK